MGTVKIIYSELKDAWQAADKAAEYCDDYAAEIRRKVTKKIDAFSGNDSGYTSSAAGYATAKIRELGNKAVKLRDYSNRVENLYNEAKDTDRSVKNYLRLEGRDFRDSHDMHVSKIAELFVNFFISRSNANPISKWIKDSRRKSAEWWRDFWAQTKYWYHFKKGKYIIKAIASALLVVLAVAAVIAAWPVLVSAIAAGAIGGIIVAAAGLIGAVIAAADALIDCIYNIKACSTFAEDPAWAARYDSFNSLSGWFEKYRFQDGLLWFSASELNAGSYVASKVVAITQAACAVINLCNMAKNTINFVKGYKAGNNWLRMKNAINVAKNSEASTGTKIKYLFSAFKVDYGTVTGAAKANPFKNYVERYNKFSKSLKAFTDAMKPVKTVGKFIIKADEKGLVTAVYDLFKGKTTFVKEISSGYGDIQGGFGALGYSGAGA